MEEYLILQICRVKLQEALDSNDRDEMIESLKYSSKMLPYSVARNGLDETRVIIYSNRGKPTSAPFDYLDHLSARWNVQGYILAIDKEFTYVQYNSYCVSFLQCRKVLERDVVWRKEDVLYRRGDKILDVDGFMTVSGYAAKIGETIDPENELYDEACAAVSVFKGLQLILDNKRKSESITKVLHMANDFLLRAVKPSLEKKEEKQAVVGLSLLVDLVIDFFAAK